MTTTDGEKTMQNQCYGSFTFLSISPEARSDNSVQSIPAAEGHQLELSWRRFNPNPKKPHEITRKNRFKNAIEKRGRGWSESDLTVAEKMGDVLEVQHVKLSANAHLHGPVNRQTVVDALTTVDMVLRILLL